MASPKKWDILAVGNAIVDVIARQDDRFLHDCGLVKGSMQLVDETQANALYGKCGPTIEISGGSAANTAVGTASLGGAVKFCGKVAEDQLGDIFSHDIQAAGVAYSTLPLADGPATARCIVVVTPDGQRTMSTFLGASALLRERDIVERDIAATALVYLEGYLWDRAEAKEAFRLATKLAKKHKRQTALTLSDLFCVERHRESFLHLIRDGVDVVFANEAELKALYQTQDFDSAVQQIRADCRIAAITRSEKGSVVTNREGIVEYPAVSVKQVIDTTGAGDLYAAGFLFGLTQRFDLPDCARAGHAAAAEIISHIGARPQTVLRSLIRN